MSKPVKVQVKRVPSEPIKKSVNDHDEDDKPSVRSAIIARLQERSK